MDIHAPQARQLQRCARKDQAVCHHDQYIRLPRGEIGPIRFRLQGNGLGNRHTALERCKLHRAGGELTPAALGPIRLSEHANELVPGSCQRLKRGQREIRRSSERKAQSAHLGGNFSEAQYV